MSYIESDDEYFKIVEQHSELLFSTIKTTVFPQTYRAFFGFCAKTNSLKTAMFDMIDSNNPYAFKALFRCYAEHYLKFTYLFIRFLKEKSDEVGDEYFSFCGAVETLDYASAISLAEGLLGNDVSLTTDRILEDLYPKAISLSRRALETASGKFKYRAILRYLSKEVPGIVAKETPFLAQIVPSYALLSSFVHGGPWTDMDMQSYAKPEALLKCEHDAEIIFMMTASVFMFTAMAVSREFPEVGSIASSTKSVINQFLSQSNKVET